MQTLATKLYSAEQVREMDRKVIEEYGIPGIALMRKAGAEVFAVYQKHYQDYPLVVFCGAGNNAGDGYVVATLAKQAGIKVDVYSLTQAEALKGEAATAYQDFMQMGGKTTGFTKKTDLSGCVVIDALLGTGLDREVTGLYAEAIDLINQSTVAVISVDIPSGLNANTGIVMGCAVKADWTVSFIGLKQGLFTGAAADYCGHVVYADLAIPAVIFQLMNHSAQLITRVERPKRQRCAHKGDHGHVLLVGGDEGFSGAIRLAAEAALRVGAGLVSVATRKSHAAYLNMARPELMCHGVEHCSELQPLLDKASVVVIGPGLGQSKWAHHLLAWVLKSDKAVVIDADGLNLLANKKLYRDNWVLTPHPGEAARLLGCSTQAIAENRFLAASQLQSIYGGIVVLKGAGSLIDKGDEVFISTTGNPGMASGGMGDVLAGMIAGLIAQKYSFAEAVNTAVYVHGEAADLSAEKEGERGLLASDLMPFIRKLMNK